MHIGASKRGASRSLSASGPRAPLTTLGPRVSNRARAGANGKAAAGWETRVWVNMTKDQASPKVYPSAFCELVAEFIAQTR
eukprot:8579844-Pyramimonas_sp.AAC.1